MCLIRRLVPRATRVFRLIRALLPVPLCLAARTLSLCLPATCAVALSLRPPPATCALALFPLSSARSDEFALDRGEVFELFARHRADPDYWTPARLAERYFTSESLSRYRTHVVL